MNLSISKLVKTTLLGSAIAFGTQANAQEQEKKPLPNYPNYFKDSNKDFNWEMPKDGKEENIFWKNPWITPLPNDPNSFRDFNFPRPLNKPVFSDDYIDFDDDYRSKGNENFLNIFLIFSGLGATSLIALFAYRRLIQHANKKSEELEETLRFARSNKFGSTNVKKQSVQEKAIRREILKILKQRSGIDPSIYK